MRLRLLRLFFLIALVVLAACNRPQSETPGPAVDSTQPLIETVPAVAETEQSKAFLPVINSGAENLEDVQVDPHIEILVSPTDVKVGDTLTVVGRPVELGLPYYHLIIRDEGVQQIEPIVQVTYDNQVKQLSGTSRVLEFISAEGQMDQATFQLKAVAAGKTTISISATGEVNIGSSGSHMWSGGGSGDVLVTVQP